MRTLRAIVNLSVSIKLGYEAFSDSAAESELEPAVISRQDFNVIKRYEGS